MSASNECNDADMRAPLPSRGRTAPGGQPPGGRQRQPGGLPGADATRMGRHDRGAQPLAPFIFRGPGEAAGARGHGGRSASDTGRACGAPAAALLPDPLPLAVRAACVPRWDSSRPSRSRSPRRSGALPSRGWEYRSASSAMRTSTGDLPYPVRRLRSRVLRDAAFVAARSDTAAQLVRSWGARGEVGLAPPAVPAWPSTPAARGERPFTVGYAGRLVESKGLMDLLAAVRDAGRAGGAAPDRRRRAEGAARGAADPRLGRPRPRRAQPRADGGRLRAARRARAAFAHHADVEGAVRSGDRRGAVVRGAGGGLGLRRDPLADRADRRRADLPGGRSRRARRRSWRRSGSIRSFARGWRRAGARRSRGCSRCPPRPMRSSACW